MKIAVKHLCCQVCGTEIPQGGMFYVGRVEIISGSDGILPETEESADRMIEKALREIMRRKSEKELMEEVHQEIRLVLCAHCRLVFRDKILDIIKH